MSDRLVLQALQTNLIDVVANSSNPTLPVKMVGRTIPSADEWLEVLFIPNNMIGRYWGKEKVFKGIFRLVLHRLNVDAGAYSGMDLMEEFAIGFDKGTTLLNGSLPLKIVNNPEVTGVLENGAEVLFPLSIRYQSFKP